MFDVRQIKLLVLLFPLLVFGDISIIYSAVDKAASPASPKEASQVVKDQVAEVEDKVVEDNTLQTLKSILELRDHLNKRLKEKKMLLRRATSESEKEKLKHDIEKLNEQLTKSSNDFDRIAVGVDVSMFQDKKEQKFDWKEEITSLVRPALDEMKRMTAKVRQKSQLNMELERATKLLPEAKEAVENLKALMAKAEDRAIKRELKKELAEWQNRVQQLENELSIASMQLEQLEREEESMVEASQKSIKHFFQTRGLYIFLAIMTFVGIFLLCWLFYRLLVKVIPGYREEHISLRLRILDLVFRVLTVVLAITGLFAVLYAAQDWVLLSIAIIFLLGIGWTARLAIPKMWNQGRLMLNIGPVREGERVLLDGIPWLVRKINVYSVFHNPELGVTLRIPIEKLLDMESRPYNKSERWFPCRKGDWVILSDGVRGRVVGQSHEMVTLVQRGGARKSYVTSDFLSLSPLNLSDTFRIKETFGISYDLQEHSTALIPDALSEYISERLKEEGYEEHLKNLRVEFQEAGASSLDLVVIADFDGEMAPLYNRIRRAVQRWCVEASTINNWEIPFPQLTVHKA